MTAEPGGGFLVTESVPPKGDGDGTSFIRRFDAKGTPDTAYGDGGAARFSGEIVRVIADANGAVVHLTVTSRGQAFLLRLTADGKQDPSFHTFSRQNIAGFTLDAEGHLLVVPGSVAFPLERLLPNGDEDESYAPNRAARTPDGLPLPGYVSSGVLDVRAVAGGRFIIVLESGILAVQL